MKEKYEKNQIEINYDKPLFIVSNKKKHNPNKLTKKIQ